MQSILLEAAGRVSGFALTGALLNTAFRRCGIATAGIDGLEARRWLDGVGGGAGCRYGHG